MTALCAKQPFQTAMETYRTTEEAGMRPGPIHVTARRTNSGERLSPRQRLGQIMNSDITFETPESLANPKGDRLRMRELTVKSALLKPAQ